MAFSSMLRSPAPIVLRAIRSAIVIVGDGDPEDRDRGTMLKEHDPATRRFETVSGNGGVVGPTGKPREGISEHDFYPDRGGYRVLWVARPGVDHLLASS
jgi:hypothetical protein